MSDMVSVQSVNAAVVTVSDTRTDATDTSGHYLQQTLQEAGHRVVHKSIVRDDLYKLRALIATLVAADDVQAIIVTGGTGFTHRDNTVDAITPLLDKTIDGFGEVFRYLSYKEIGSSTIQSRAFAGVSNDTLIFCLPGSTGACRTAWNGIIAEQLDSRHKPCHFVDKLKLVDQSS